MRYAPTEPDVLRGAELQLYKAEHLCLLGGNGAGKTTLLSCLIGTAKPQRGKIRLQKNCRLAMLPQRPQALFTQDDVLSDSLEVGEETDARAWAEKLELTGLLDRHPFDLSGGELQRVLLALALEPMPNILILDEPLSGVDVEGMSLLMDMLDEIRKKFDLSILMTTHDFSMLERYCDQVVLLQGKILRRGTPLDVLSSDEFAKAFHMGGGAQA